MSSPDIITSLLPLMYQVAFFTAYSEPAFVAELGGKFTDILSHGHKSIVVSL